MSNESKFSKRAAEHVVAYQQNIFDAFHYIYINKKCTINFGKHMNIDNYIQTVKNHTYHTTNNIRKLFLHTIQKFSIDKREINIFLCISQKYVQQTQSNI